MWYQSFIAAASVLVHVVKFQISCAFVCTSSPSLKQIHTELFADLFNDSAIIISGLYVLRTYFADVLGSFFLPTDRVTPPIFMISHKEVRSWFGYHRRQIRFDFLVPTTLANAQGATWLHAGRRRLLDCHICRNLACDPSFHSNRDPLCHSYRESVHKHNKNFWSSCSCGLRLAHNFRHSCFSFLLSRLHSR